MCKQIIVVPAGGMGPGICDIIQQLDYMFPIKVKGFLDDDPDLVDNVVYGYPVLGPIQASFIEGYACHEDAYFAIAGFANDKDITRVKRLRKTLAIPESKFPRLIHPAAFVSEHSHIGAGTVIFPGVYIAPGVTIGSHTMVMSGVSIGHNSVIGDYCNICSGAVISGYVNVGDAAWIGANASINSKVKVGSEALVGIGAVVLRDVAPSDIVVGNPARFLRKVD